MTYDRLSTPHLALPCYAPTVARLLHDFNREFDTPVPDEKTLARRWETLLSRDDVLVLLAADSAFAYLTLRPTPYWDGPLAQLEELYVAPPSAVEESGLP